MSILDLAADAQDVKGSSTGEGFTKTLPREGIAMLRMSGYVELGVQEQEWKGKKKLAKPVIVTFELVHPDHKIKNKEGEFVGYHTVDVRLSKSDFEKSNYMRLFKKLNYNGKVKYAKGTIPSLAKFLGDGFLGKIYHNTVGEGDKARTYVNLYEEPGDYTIGAPNVPITDETGLPTGEVRPIKIPEMNAQPRLFIWEAPGMSDEAYRDMFQSISIVGTKKDGSPKNNWLVDIILGPENVALPGSRTEALFVKDKELEGLVGEATESNSLAKAVEKVKASVAEREPFAPHVDTFVDEFDSEEDPLTALGL